MFSDELINEFLSGESLMEGTYVYNDDGSLKKEIVCGRSKISNKVDIIQIRDLILDNVVRDTRGKKDKPESLDFSIFFSKDLLEEMAYDMRIHVKLREITYDPFGWIKNSKATIRYEAVGGDTSTQETTIGLDGELG